MSLVKKLVDHFSPSRGDQEYSVSIFGLGWSGKSTVIGTLANVTPNHWGRIGIIPTPITVLPSNGKPLKFIARDFGMGCGSMGNMGRLYAEVVAMTDAMIWVIDAADEMLRISESRDDLNRIINAVDWEREKLGKKGDFPILLLANKQDLPDARPVEDMRDQFPDPRRGKQKWTILPTAATKPYHESGLVHAVDWLQVVFDNPSGRYQPPLTDVEVAKAKYPKESTSRIETWIGHLKSDVDDDEFLQLFDTFKLPAWTHYMHIRMTYLLLTRNGRKAGIDKIFDGLKAYTENSSSAGSFNLTMTYFWTQIVHLGIQNVTSSKVAYQGRVSSALTTQEKDDFARFLLVNPYVANGNLWKDFYSTECMTGQAASSTMVLPDIKPLPTLVDRDMI